MILIYYNNSEIAAKNSSSDSEHQRFDYADYSTILALNLRSEYNPLSADELTIQVAGHGADDYHPDDNNGPGILIASEDYILKPVQDVNKQKHKGLTEVAFYSHITKSSDTIDKRIRGCIPRYGGVHHSKSTLEEKENNRGFYIILENIADGYELPAVMDIKLGRKLYGPDATAEERDNLDGRHLGTRVPLGYSISGILSYSLRKENAAENSNTRIKHTEKWFGKTLTADHVQTILKLFYDSKHSRKISILNDLFVKKLTDILETFELQSQYHIYGCSLLFAYDAVAVRRFLNGTIELEMLEQFVNVKLVDFANVYESNGEKDENFLFGLRNVLALFKSFSSQ